MQPLSQLSLIIDQYDAFILDLWGVIHDGSHLYPGVHATLTAMRKAGKKIIMLSNAPRRAHKVETVLNQLGVEAALYDGVMSSGEAGFLWLSALSLRERGGESRGEGIMGQVEKVAPHPNPLPKGEGMWKRYFYIGPGKDADVLDGLDYKRTDDLKDADFLLNVGFGSEEQSDEDVQPLLRAARALGLPMLCLNPDLEVVKQTGQRFPCAGVIGYGYERMGGEVTWFGKPYPEVYGDCLKMLGGIKKERILAIGDSVGTDIKGAVGMGIDAALVTGGILTGKSESQIAAISEEEKAMPRYIMPRLEW